MKVRRNRRSIQVCRNSAGAKGHARSGFTLIELLVVIAIIAILASMLLPVLGQTKQKAQGVLCMSNQRQVTLAWLMHAEDNEGRFAYAGPGITPGAYDPNSWMSGWIDYDPANRSNWDPTVDIYRSPLWPYCGNAVGVFRCPADYSTIAGSGQ